MIGTRAKKVCCGAGLAAAAVIGAVSVPAGTAAALPSFTWSGQGSALHDPFWSNAKNWQGGAVPIGSVGTLSFPKLGGGCSPASSSTKTCYVAGNDISGLSLQGITIDDAEGYSFSERGIALGSGGIRAAPGRSQCPCGGMVLLLPITLTASQTWSIDGGAIGFASASFGHVAGAGYALHMIVKHGAQVSVEETEVGPVSITSPRSSDVFNNGILLGQPGHSGGSLNGTDASPVSISGVALASTNGVVGPLSASHDAALWDEGFQPAGSLRVHGTVTLDSSTEVIVYVTHAGSTPGKDYWQLRASGNVSLGGSHLGLSVSNSRGYGPDQPCPKLDAGDVETLVSTTGLIQGRLEGISKRGYYTGTIKNGATVPISCRGKTTPKVRILYHAHSVTAVVQ